MPTSFVDDFRAAFPGAATVVRLPGGGHDAGWLDDEAAVNQVMAGLEAVVGRRAPSENFQALAAL